MAATRSTEAAERAGAISWLQPALPAAEQPAAVDVGAEAALEAEDLARVEAEIMGAIACEMEAAGSEEEEDFDQID